MKQRRATPSPFLSTFTIESANLPRVQGGRSEDYTLVDQGTGLVGVLDSVGGRDCGQWVSQVAGKAIATAWKSLPNEERQGPPAQLEAALQRLIRQADTALAALPIPPEQRRPATTVVLGVLSSQQGLAHVTVAHIGDSRAYLLREGQSIRRLTRDNGYFSLAIRRGEINEEDAWRIEQATQACELTTDDVLRFTRRNEITCAVGWTDFPRIPASSLALLPGDRLLLCTDGVHDNLTDQEIEEVLRGSPEADAHLLVSAAYRRSLQSHFRAKPDDISAVIATYLADWTKEGAITPSQDNIHPHGGQ